MAGFIVARCLTRPLIEQGQGSFAARINTNADDGGVPRHRKGLRCWRDLSRSIRICISPNTKLPLLNQSGAPCSPALLRATSWGITMGAGSGKSDKCGAGPITSVTLCVCTCRRPEFFSQFTRSLETLIVPSVVTFHLSVSDNNIVSHYELYIRD